LVTPQNAYYATAAPSTGAVAAGKSGRTVGMLGMSKAEASKGR
jgi:hypothetical protein